MHPFGFARKLLSDGTVGPGFMVTNDGLDAYYSTPPIRDFMQVQFLKYLAHIIRRDASHLTKMALFVSSKKRSSHMIWQKVKYLTALDKDEAIRKMNDRKEFTLILQARFPYLKRQASLSSKARTKIRW